MTRPHQESPIRNLPTMVLDGIRSGEYRVHPGDDAALIRIMTRVVRNADAAGHDVMPILVDYAANVDAAMDRTVPISDWTPLMREIHEMVWPFSASAYALRSTFWVDSGRPSGVAALTEAFRAWIAEREAEQATTPAQADADIRAEMERVKALFPRLGMSYGYIGNIWHGPYRDDRSFRVFTQVQRTDAAHGETLGFGDHAHADLPKLRTMVLARLEDWARDLDARLSANALRLRSTRHLEGTRDLLAA